MSGAGVNPRVVRNYDGQDIVLNQELGVVLRTADFPEIRKYQGQDLIVTDGTTLLGADDKAGVAEIVTLCQRLMAEDLPHGRRL